MLVLFFESMERRDLLPGRAAMWQTVTGVGVERRWRGSGSGERVGMERKLVGVPWQSHGGALLA